MGIIKENLNILLQKGLQQGIIFLKKENKPKKKPIYENNTPGKEKTREKKEKGTKEVKEGNKETDVV